MKEPSRSSQEVGGAPGECTPGARPASGAPGAEGGEQTAEDLDQGCFVEGGQAQPECLRREVGTGKAKCRKVV